MATRTAIVKTSGNTARILATVKDYLPRNYRAIRCGNEIVIVGEDSHDWTLDGYVIPRLASGLIVAEETTGDPVPAEVSFTDWLRKVDWILSESLGIHHDDLADWLWRDAYDNGETPLEAARGACEEDDVYVQAVEAGLI